MYIGTTTNIAKRLKEHNSGKSEYTKRHKPYKLTYYVATLNKKDAERHERYLKSAWRRKFLKSTIREYLNRNLMYKN